ncbi:MAG: aldo/keto reductase [Alphaproteobacteria bacterium]
MPKTGGVRVVNARGGAAMPALGLGTWHMGEDRRRRKDEVAALALGLDLGMGLIDTAEMYGDGGAEEVVADAVRGRRDEVFIVSKVLPQNASKTGTLAACERSLKRLGTDRIDLYLLHWKGSYPLAETLDAFDRLARAGKIRFWGVSNFDTADMTAAERHPLGSGIVSNQVLYNLARRGVESSLLGWCAERRVAVMAYSPLDQARLKAKPALGGVAARHGVSPECVAIAWTLRNPMLVSIPKATNPDHVRANVRAAGLALSPVDLAELDQAYPPPKRETALEML